MVIYIAVTAGITEKGERVAVSKRLRYEVFRRDDHTCRHCGARAPDVEITIDHVVPVALGGGDEPSNLATACKDCNSGKSSSSPDAPLVGDVADKSLEWAQAMRQAQVRMLADIDARQADRDQFRQWWDGWSRDGALMPKDAGWEQTVDQFRGAGLPLLVVKDCIELAMTRRKVQDDNRFKYMCGIAWSKITELQKAARSFASAGTVDSNEGASPVTGRADLAREFLGDLEPGEIERLLAEAREDWNAATDDEQHVAAAHIAWQEARTGLAWLGYSVAELLPLIPDEVIRKAMRRARAELYDVHGPEFSRAAFAQEAADTAARLYEEKAAADYLADMPDEERAEWIAYANAVFASKGRELSGRSAVVMPAHCARVIKSGRGPLRNMCHARGKHISLCPERLTRYLQFGEFECCREGGEEHKDHAFCERHSEVAIAGAQQCEGLPVTVVSWQMADEDEMAVPF